MRFVPPDLKAIYRRAAGRLRALRRPCAFREQGLAIGVLERDGVITAAEAHALIAGERLADLYADVAASGAGIGLDQLAEIEGLIRLGALTEAVHQLGRLHPALSDLPYLFDRSAARARA